MRDKRRRAACEMLESRLLLSSDNAVLASTGVSNITTTGISVQHLQVIYQGASVDASTFGNGNLTIIGPSPAAFTITYTGQGTVAPSLAGTERIADYDLTSNVPLTDNTDDYVLTLADGQVGDGQGGTFGEQELGLFQVLIPTTSPITLMDSHGATLTSGTTVDFGTVTLEQDQPSISRTFSIRNNGKTPASITIGIGEPTTEGSLFTSTPLSANPIAAGATATFTATLDVHILTINTGQNTEPFDIDVTPPASDVYYPEETLNFTALVNPAPPRIAATTDVTAKKPAVYTDANRQKVSVRLTGPGDATVGFATIGNADIRDLTLNGTTAASSLTITPVGGGSSHTTITGNINITGAIGRFIAPRVDLVSDRSTDGYSYFDTSSSVGTLSIGNVTGLEQVDIYGHLKTPLHFIAGNIADVQFASGGPVASIHVQSWTDTGASASQPDTESEQLEAPKINQFVCVGDFTAGVNLIDKGTMNEAEIGGSLGSDPWIITGNARNLQIGAIPSGFSSTIGGKLTSLTVAGDDDGIIAAGQIGAVTIEGNLTGGKILAGANLGSDGVIGSTVTSGQDTYAAGAINSIEIDGTAANAFVSAGFEPMDGLFDNADGSGIAGKSDIIKTIVVRGGLGAGTLFVAAAFKSARVPNEINPAGNTQFVILPDTHVA